MRKNADLEISSIKNIHKDDHVIAKDREDPRITPLGKILRKFSLDELPQLFDVWRGKMSLVGPRPEVPAYVECYPADVRLIVLSVRPGITDRASIEFKDENEILGKAIDPHKAYIENVLPIKLKYYADYVASRSLVGDFVLILLTFRALIR